MKLTLPLEEISPSMSGLVGGKTVALAKLHHLGYPIPQSLAISTMAYQEYLQETGLGVKILMELGRKDFQEMRWEELWDAALRIRNLFLTTPIPSGLQKELAETLEKKFYGRPLVVRSSSPCEDSSGESFAGLHDSFVNVQGKGQLLQAVRKVWASLWSDRALLYRQELGLDIETSAMGVLVQELVVGEKSGVAFSRSPTNREQVAVEAVWGLNQGLVDGSIEPDFWALDRRGENILELRPASRELKMTPAEDGLIAMPLPEDQLKATPITEEEVIRVAQSTLALEKALGEPQDVEWTLVGNELVILQSRPITNGRQGDAGDPRGWYLSLHRSLENLKSLQRKIEEKIIPGMENDAKSFAGIDLQPLSDEELADEIKRRREVLSHWESVYRSECIPMAHGVRLFGEFYNDALRPSNPFEFVELLRGESFLAIERNQKLAALSQMVLNDSTLVNILEETPDALPAQLSDDILELAESNGLSIHQVTRLVSEMARKAFLPEVKSNEALQKAYLDNFKGQNLKKAREILDIGRASYRLRDDDNISLGKINHELARAEREGRRRLDKNTESFLKPLLKENTDEDAVVGPSVPKEPFEVAKNGKRESLRVRQLQGQPASPGLATAKARVVRSKDDLEAFGAGEILVCDAIDPTMTFVVPLAAGIIERRGGMLIHGAIIAREYGIPCVTGIADATLIIENGDRITLDGYLGIVFFPPSSGRISSIGRDVPKRRDMDDFPG